MQVKTLALKAGGPSCRQKEQEHIKLRLKLPCLADRIEQVPRQLRLVAGARVAVEIVGQCDLQRVRGFHEGTAQELIEAGVVQIVVSRLDRLQRLTKFGR